MLAFHAAVWILTSSLAQQPALPPAAASFDLAVIAPAAAEAGAIPSFLDVPTMQWSCFRIDAGAADERAPDPRDAVYHVLAGKAVFDAGASRYDAKPGTILFVGANVANRFVDVTEPLTILACCSEQVPTTGGMIRGPRPTKQTPYPETSPRGSTRIFYWFGPGSAGQLAIDYGLPRWQTSYAPFLASQTTQRWRFGQDFWTRLDTNIPLTIGGVEVPAGDYYLVLESDAKDGLRMIALDPRAIRAAKLDAYQAPQTTGGIAIPMRRDDDADVNADRLRMTLEVVDRAKDAARLIVDFGPVRMTADVVMHPGA